MLWVILEKGCTISFPNSCLKDYISVSTAPQQLDEGGVGLHKEPAPTPKTIKVISVRETNWMVSPDVQINSGILPYYLLDQHVFAVLGET
jgi:hypothetical protein